MKQQYKLAADVMSFKVTTATSSDFYRLCPGAQYEAWHYPPVFGTAVYGHHRVVLLQEVCFCCEVLPWSLTHS